MTRIVIVGVITSGALIVAILALIRARHLQERYAILWLLAASGVVVFGLWTDALELLADMLGIAYPPSALFFITAVFAVAVLLHTAVVITRLSSQNQTLAQRLAMAEERLRRLESAFAEREGEADASPEPDEGFPRSIRLVPERRRRTPVARSQK
jgi:hypothetical protein